MICAIGTDLVDVSRLRGYLSRVPGLSRRLFTDAELTACQGRPDSLAARLAAKEAVLKALGSTVQRTCAPATGWRYREVEVSSVPGSAPSLCLSGSLAQVSASAGITRWHLTLAHDGGLAQAFVVAEGAAQEHGPLTPR